MFSTEPRSCRMCALGALPPVVNLPPSEKTTDQPDADVDQITFLASWRTMLAAGLLSAVVMLCAGTISAQTPVTTWHYDNARTSANMTETVLTPANVTPTSFGKLFSEPVDGIVSAQPLYLPGVVIPG